MKKDLFILFLCVFIVMVGYGLTLTVLPFFIERLALDAGATSRMVFIHVGALTGVFALMQFFFAPFWGKWSDRIGRRPLFLIGLGGNAFSNVFFGLGTSLSLLYAARILGGIISSAILPAVTAYVADLTSESERGKGMAWLGSATGLGVVAGPVLGAWLSELKWHLTFRFDHFYADAFSTPFFVAALLSLLTLSLALMMLPESLKVGGMLKAELTYEQEATEKTTNIRPQRKLFSEPLMGLFLLSFVGQFALSLFEGTFALHGQRVMRFGPAQLGAVFMVCGLVMALAQASLVGWLISRWGGRPLLPFGLALMGISLILLMEVQSMAPILILVFWFALGMAILIPSTTTLVTQNAGRNQGKALGWQSGFNSLGQALGPLIGGLLLGWRIHLPYLVTGLILIGMAIFSGRKNRLEFRPSL